MKVGFRLVSSDGDRAEHFALESADGKTHGDMQVAYQYFCDNTTVLGLGFSFQGSTITLAAESNQLRPSVVADIRRTAQAAIDLIN
jgi:hypothetical protein